MMSVDLSPEEIADRARELADLEVEYESLDLERAEHSADYRAKMKAIRERIRKLVQMVRTGQEDRDGQLGLELPRIGPDAGARR